MRENNKGGIHVTSQPYKTSKHSNGKYITQNTIMENIKHQNTTKWCLCFNMPSKPVTYLLFVCLVLSASNLKILLVQNK